MSTFHYNFHVNIPLQPPRQHFIATFAFHIATVHYHCNLVTNVNFQRQHFQRQFSTSTSQFDLFNITLILCCVFWNLGPVFQGRFEYLALLTAAGESSSHGDGCNGVSADCGGTWLQHSPFVLQRNIPAERRSTHETTLNMIDYRLGAKSSTSDVQLILML